MDSYSWSLARRIVQLKRDGNCIFVHLRDTLSKAREERRRGGGGGQIRRRRRRNGRYFFSYLTAVWYSLRSRTDLLWNEERNDWNREGNWNGASLLTSYHSSRPVQENGKSDYSTLTLSINGTKHKTNIFLTVIYTQKEYDYDSIDNQSEVGIWGSSVSFSDRGFYLSVIQK